MAEERIIDLAVKAEDWRAQVCSCVNCDSFQCFALRHHSSPGCSCNKCNRSKTCIFYNNVFATLSSKSSNFEKITNSDANSEVQKLPRIEKVDKPDKSPPQGSENVGITKSKENSLKTLSGEEKNKIDESNKLESIQHLANSVVNTEALNTKPSKSNESDKGDGNKISDSQKSVVIKKDPLLNRITVMTTKSKNKYINNSTTAGDGTVKETIAKEVVYEFDKNKNIRKKISKEQTTIQRVPPSSARTSLAKMSNHKQIIEGKGNVIMKKLDSYVMPKVTKEATSEIIKKLKEIYIACSCKVCECIASIAPKKEGCSCKPCECDESRIWSNKEKLTKAKINNSLSKQDNYNCKCEQSLKYTDKKKNIVFPNKYTTDACKCDKPCMCIKCLYSQNVENVSYGTANQRDYIVSRVGEGVQRITCDCSPCGCFDCVHPYGSITRTPVSHDIATEVRRHLNCNCEMCNNDHCEQEGADTCNCDRHSKLMRKPVQRDPNDYGIHHFTIKTAGNKQHEMNQNTQHNVVTVRKSKIINKNINDSRPYPYMLKGWGRNAEISSKNNISKLANSLQDCDCKPCECIKCRKHFIEGHIPSQHQKECFCEICDCINSGSPKTLKQIDSKEVCDCKPCDCIECRQFNVLGLSTENHALKCHGNTQNHENALKGSESCPSKKSNSASKHVLPLINATNSRNILDVNATNEEGKNHSVINGQSVSLTPNLKSKEDLQLYCAITQRVKYSNDSNSANVYETIKPINMNFVRKSNIKSILQQPYISENHRGTTEWGKNEIGSLGKRIDSQASYESTLSSCISTSETTHVAFNSSVSPDNKRESTKSRDSSCNSSGHDNSDYLIRFPRSTVETCINDVMNLNVYKKSNHKSYLKTPIKTKFENEYSIVPIANDYHNRISFKGRNSYENEGVLKVDNGRISHIKICKNWNSDEACDCRPCDCIACSYKTRKFDKCRCDCAACSCCGTCISGDQSFLMKNELSQTASIINSGEECWDSNCYNGSITNTLVHFYPSLNPQELESRVSKDRETSLLRESNVTFKETPYSKIISTSPFRNSSQDINSCLSSSFHKSPLDIQFNYDSVQKTLKEAKAFSLELLEILQKYEKANKEFKSMSDKYKVLHEPLLNNDYITKGSNRVKSITDEHKYLKEEQENTELTDNVKKLDYNKLESSKIVLPEVLPKSDVSTNISSESVSNISKPQTENTLVIPIKSSTLNFKDDSDKKKDNDTKSTLKSLKSQYETFSKQINRAMIRCRREAWKKSSISTINCLEGSQYYAGNANTKKAEETCKETSKIQDNRDVDRVYISSIDKRFSDSLHIKQEHALKTDQLLYENKSKIGEDATHSKDGLVKVDSTENGEIYAVSKRKEYPSNRLPTSKGFLNISDLEEASTSQEEHSKAEINRKFDSMPTMASKRASSFLSNSKTADGLDIHFMGTSASDDPMKVSFQAVRKVSDHTIIVKWNLPRVVTDVLGYELLVDGRAVQNILSPTRNMAVVTCLPHSEKILLTVRTITSKTACDSYPSTTLVYRPRVKHMS